jgi:hypothetical protein
MAQGVFMFLGGYLEKKLGARLTALAGCLLFRFVILYVQISVGEHQKRFFDDMSCFVLVTFQQILFCEKDSKIHIPLSIMTRWHLGQPLYLPV